MTAKRFTLVDDYLIEYDGSYFDLHKPSDIRSLITVIGYVTDENEQLKCKIELLQNEIDMLNGKGIEFKSITDLKNKYYDGDGE